MDNGKELIEMVCTGYESPDDAPEDDQHDFSMLNENSPAAKTCKALLVVKQACM